METRKCNECKWKQDFENTTKTGEALCTFRSNYFPIQLDCECRLISDKIECFNCTHFQEYDAACMTAEAYDDASECCGFEDYDLTQLEHILFTLCSRYGAQDAFKKIDEAYARARDEFQRWKG